jgi:hypothetical protein
VDDCATESFVVRQKEGARANLHVTVAFPIAIAGRVLGVMVFAGCDVREREPRRSTPSSRWAARSASSSTARRSAGASRG